MDQSVCFLPPIQVSKSYDWLMDTQPNTQPNTHPTHKMNEPLSPPDDQPPSYRQIKSPTFMAPPRTSSIKSQPQRGLHPVVIPQPSPLTRIMMPSPPVSPRTPTFSPGQRTSASSFGSTSTSTSSASTLSTSTSSSGSSTYKPDRQVFMKQWMRILDDAERMVVRGEMEKDRGRNL
ncbi:uncharacterized protein SPPG_06344 [Spizellomyces punctatus DAOM BR117]|uniref:Uncharacterized protein n=1 Tax=Spizellomyces punctatus (strain DAOM BR117) TaxID=645134 RepID=A0A0L0HD74_SPIPD|nr:uncharacterized protein SPPG_06344 [Spizellomyces punctatus DAOM BR117]KNC98663.1 hypothetical protein SPPG_06344 [Spizellomyces punctatus DAOM BR117]|eukprot:XP_016606703.1 hypothetical protein SPPG_06344 [Spizellomyces punctatus DAOM BR117]